MFVGKSPLSKRHSGGVCWKRRKGPTGGGRALTSRSSGLWGRRQMALPLPALFGIDNFNAWLLIARLLALFEIVGPRSIWLYPYNESFFPYQFPGKIRFIIHKKRMYGNRARQAGRELHHMEARIDLNHFYKHKYCPFEWLLQYHTSYGGNYIYVKDG